MRLDKARVETKEMDEWMRKRADHQGDKLEAFLAHVKVTEEQQEEIVPNQTKAQNQIDELRKFNDQNGK